MLYPKNDEGKKLPIVVMLGAGGKEALAAETGPDSPTALAKAGSMVILPDLCIRRVVRDPLQRFPT